MTQYRSTSTRARTAVCSAAAVALVMGSAGYAGAALAGSASETSVAVSKKDRKAVAKAERAVEKAANSLSARLALANAYLQVGRFEAAATTFEDAQALGDKSPFTALSLALAYVGAGQDGKAKAMLDLWQDSIPASDLGLAIALAGDTGRGVSILADALRAGDDTAKMRQNLAYAYALDGRWREARLMASQDVSPDLLDARISDWAMQARPEDYRKRVAALLGVPLRSDVGQPAELALSVSPEERFAAIPVAAPTSAVAALEPPAWNAELPASASDAADDFYVADAAPVQAVAAPMHSKFTQAFVEPNEAAPQSRFVSNPVVQQVPQSVPARAAAPMSRPVTVGASQQEVRTAAVKPVTWVRADAKDSTHVVQLGSFSTPENAERAWKIFVQRDPSLANFDKTITRAEVRGKTYWRVAAAGFDRHAAKSMCSVIKGKGRACIAYAADRPLPGGLPGRAEAKVRTARR